MIMKHPMPILFLHRLILALCLLPSLCMAGNKAPWVGLDFQERPCSGSDGSNWYGPYDYSKPSEKGKIPIVEEHHFNANVENHIRGQEGYLGGDLNYTLMAIPNHHRALLSIINFQLKLNKKLISFKDNNNLLTTPVECYLQRAIHFSPEDPATYSLYAYYFRKLNKLNESKKFYEKALFLDPESEKLAYSYGLLMLDMKDYDSALKYAKKAYRDKRAPPGLRNKLTSLGKWAD